MIETTRTETAELVDVVSEQNEVLYSVLRTDAHMKGLLHKTVIAEVRDSQGDFLLVVQAASKQDAGLYVEPVGGHVKAGEAVSTALKRETFEETGLTDFGHKFVGKFVFDRPMRDGHENHYFIVYEIYNNKELKLNEEAVSYRHFTKEELTKELRDHRERFGEAYLAVVERFYPELMVNKIQTKVQV